MANKIILKKSSVVGKSPVVGDLDYGEMALNYADGKLFYKNSNNQIQFLGDRGFTGSLGFTGSQGTTGFVGSQGATGFTGSQGDSGRVQWVKKTANYTAVDQDGIIADTTGGSFTVTLPATPVLGTIVTIVDGGDWTVNPLTVDRNGSTIEGVADNTLLDITGAQVTFLYDGATWQIFASFISWGYTGSQGDIGYTGSQGVIGFTGSQGVIGFTGSQGAGFTGSQGASSVTTWTGKTANYTASSLEGIIANTSAGSFTVTLPAAPTQGSYVIISDGADWSVNPLTVARNGSTIEGQTSDFVLDINNIIVEFLYDGSTWQVYANVGQRGYTGSQGVTGFTGSANYVSIVEDSTTNSSFYVPFTSSTSGSLTDAKVSSTKLYFNPNTGQLNATEFNSLSDETVKTNMNPITDAISIINNLEGFRFNWKDTNKQSIGVSAQNIEQYLPELVSLGTYKTVNYNGLIPVLIQAIKELDRRIKEK
jgi:hypothetical protein